MSQQLTDVTLDVAVTAARQVLYRFAALSLLDPKFHAWEQLDALKRDDLLPEAAGLLRATPAAVPEKLALGERSLETLDPTQVLQTLPASSADLNKAYEEVFGLLVSNACPPYETEYIHSKLTFQRSNAMADVSGFYRAFGLATSARNPERPDHIVQQLEFMAVLLGLTRQAAETGGSEERLAICRDAQARFLREHLVWWVPAFATLLGRHAASEYYRSVAGFLSALVACERALFGLPEPTELAAPSQVEPPEACDGCALHSDD